MTILYCNAEEHTIEDDNGKKITIEKTRELFNTGQIEDCNLSFQRLANYDFNWNKLDKFYQENP